MKYAVYIVERDENDNPISWEERSKVLDTFQEAWEVAARVMHPCTEIVELAEGFGVLTPHFA